MRIEEKKEVIITDDEFYKKSNALINSKGQIGKIAFRLFALGMNYAKLDKETKTIISKIPVKKLKELTGTKSNSIYDRVLKLTVGNKENKERKSLMDWRIIVKDEEQEKFQAIQVITDATYENGYLTIRYNNLLNRELVELKGNYTILSLRELLNLDSIHSAQLYEMLTSHLNFLRAKYHTSGAVSWTINLIELEMRMGIIEFEKNLTIYKESIKMNPDYDLIEKIAKEENLLKYKTFGRFNQSILKKAVKEINEKTTLDIEIDTTKVKRGAKVTDITFIINEKEKNIVKAEEIEVVSNDLTEREKMTIIVEIGRIIKEKLDLKDLEAIAEAAEYRLERVFDAYSVAEKSGSAIKNLTAWMIAAIQKGYKKPVVKTAKKDKFRNFEEREYDFDELEKKYAKN